MSIKSRVIIYTNPQSLLFLCNPRNKDNCGLFPTHLKTKQIWYRFYTLVNLWHYKSHAVISNHSLQLEVTSHLLALVYTSTYCPTAQSTNNPRIEYKYHAIIGQFDNSYFKNYLFQWSAMRATLLYLLRFSCLVKDARYIKQLDNK